MPDTQEILSGPETKSNPFPHHNEGYTNGVYFNGIYNADNSMHPPIQNVTINANGRLGTAPSGSSILLKKTSKIYYNPYPKLSTLYKNCDQLNSIINPIQTRNLNSV